MVEESWSGWSREERMVVHFALTLCVWMDKFRAAWFVSFQEVGCGFH